MAAQPQQQLLDQVAALTRRGVDCIVCVGKDVDGPGTTTAASTSTAAGGSEAIPCDPTVCGVVAYMAKHGLSTCPEDSKVIGVGAWSFEASEYWVLPIIEGSGTGPPRPQNASRGLLAPFTNVITVMGARVAREGHPAGPIMRYST